MFNKKNIINKNLIIFIICSFFSIIIFFSSDIDDIKYFRIHFSKFFSLIFSPKKTLNDLSLLRIENDILIQEIKEISQENLNLNQRIRTINIHRDYDKKLNRLIPNHSFIPAKVLFHSLSKSINIFNVNVGTKDGISNDYKAVINYDGNLVGKTWAVTESHTQIHKISDKNFNVYVQNINDVLVIITHQREKTLDKIYYSSLCNVVDHIDYF